jgi:large subunit ribosomal protein L25
VSGERIKLVVRERDKLGSRDSRRLRRQGLIPGVLYGQGQKPHPFAVPERQLRAALTTRAGLHAILDVQLDGQSNEHSSVLKDYQQDPLRGKILHIDLQEVRLDQPIHATVVVELVGEAVGTKEGGVLTQVSRELNVEALPTAVPEHIDADVSELRIGDALRLSDLTPPEGVTFLDDPDDTVLANVSAPRVEIEPEEEELAEGEEPEEGAEEAAAEGEAEAGSEGEPETTEG